MRSGRRMALETVEDIEALADGWMEMADALHRRILRGLLAGQLDQAAAQDHFRQESALRQQADALYADAVAFLVKGLALEQGDLLGVIHQAEEKIQSLADLRSVMAVLGDALILAAAVVAGEPAPIVAAVQGLRADLG